MKQKIFQQDEKRREEEDKIAEIPLKPIGRSKDNMLVDEFGKILPLSSKCSEEKLIAEVIRRKYNPEFTVKDARDIIEAGWNYELIFGHDGLVETISHYSEIFDLNLDIQFGPYMTKFLPSYSPPGKTGITYYPKVGEGSFKIDLTYPPFHYPSLIRFEDAFVLHELAHIVQCQLTGMDTKELLEKTYNTVENGIKSRKYISTLGFSDKNIKFHMFTYDIPEEFDKFFEGGYMESVARHLRDLHSDAIAYRMGQRHVILTPEEKNFGISKKGKMLMELVYATFPFLPRNVQSYVDEEKIDERGSMTLFARMRAILRVMKEEAGKLSVEEQKILNRSMEVSASAERVWKKGGRNEITDIHDVVEYEPNSTLSQRIGRLEDEFKKQMEILFPSTTRESGEWGKIYDQLTEFYAEYFRYSISLPSPFGDPTFLQRYREMLNDEGDMRKRLYVSYLLGDFRDVRALPLLKERIGKNKRKR